MKKQLWQVAGFLAALLATSTAVGQTKQSDSTVHIPFAFTVANRALPPGVYIVTRPGGKVLRIFNSGSNDQGTFAITNNVEGRAEERGKLVFHRYGNTYFLSEVWFAASRSGRKVLQSQSEEELARKRTDLELAELQIER